MRCKNGCFGRPYYENSDETGLIVDTDIGNALASLDSTAVVNLSLDFAEPVDFEKLADLVNQFEIDGLSAEFTPKNSGERIIVVAEFSIYGPPCCICAK